MPETSEKIYKIRLTKGKEALVDYEDWLLYGSNKWCASQVTSSGLYYAIRGAGKTRVKLHILIAKPIPGMEVDHENGNTLDNRRCNLVVKSKSGNQRNARKSIANTSGVTGVSFHSRIKKWIAVIRVEGKQKHLGTFNLKEDAINARKTAEKQYGYHENHGR